MRTLVRIQLRGYAEPGLGQPIHIPFVDGGDGRALREDGVLDNTLANHVQASIAHILGASRVSLGLPADAPIIAQIEAGSREIVAGTLTDPLRTLDAGALPDTIPGAISLALYALAIEAGAALPSTEP